MKAIVMTAPGGPEVLRLDEVGGPALERATDILVRVVAASVNPVDTKMRARPSGYPLPVPKVLGCDGAGVVEAVGGAVTGFRPGDEVYWCQVGAGERFGSYAQYVLVDHRLAAHKPASLTFEQAAAVPLTLITAWESLHDRAGLRRGQKVLVHAGAGGVGHIAIQLARLAGAEVGTTVGSADGAAFAGGLGAQRVILYRQENFVEAALAWTDGRGVDIGFDTVGGQTFSDSFAATRVYGDVVSLLLPPADADWATARLRNQRISLVIMLTPAFYGLTEAMAHQGGILRQAATLFDQGQIKVHVDRVWPLAQAALAHVALAQGGIMGKLVLRVD